ncbi:hypothetical protein [Oscillatoria salina]|uniref:hypothetical protein n=1 Tax=Oscillatoria salina TaxID=331517 RepID=UPI001CD024BC|nr:hypothetical protein [Oscillatoria salina]MBZ8181616.1 hypothetical protein [Oscillatoria salina IIICB1]
MEQVIHLIIVTGLLIWILYNISNWLIKIILIIGAIALGSLAIAVIPAGVIWSFRQVWQQIRLDKSQRILAIFLPIVTVLAGISLGLFWQLGFTNLWIPIAICFNTLPLLTILVYRPIQRLSLIRQYRESERDLISP